MLVTCRQVDGVRSARRASTRCIDNAHKHIIIVIILFLLLLLLIISRNDKLVTAEPKQWSTSRIIIFLAAAADAATLAPTGQSLQQQ